MSSNNATPANEREIASSSEAVSIGSPPAALSEQDELTVHNFIETLPVAACCCDDRGRVFHYNQGAVRLWGCAPSAGNDLWCGAWRLYNTDGTPLPLPLCPITTALRTGHPISGHEIVIQQNGEGKERHLLYYVQPLKAEKGLRKDALLLFVDISEHKNGENELRRAESELRDFVETTNIGLHWVGPDGRILWANQAELAMLGYTRAEYIGHHIAEFHADRPVIENILARLSRGENIRDYAARLQCKDGSIRHVIINSSALFKNGEFIHTRCFTHDITVNQHVEQQRVQLLAREWAAREEAEALLEMSREFLTESDLQKLIKVVISTARDLTKAQFGMFVYKDVPESGSVSLHCAVEGAPRETFLDVGDPQHAELVQPIFFGSETVRANDLLDTVHFQHKRVPFAGLLGKRLPLRSYLEVPVVSRAGEVMGRLFLGHPEPDLFSERAERIVRGIAAQAALALENGRLLTQRESRERRFREMIDALPAAVYTTDADGKLTHYNQAAINFSGQIPQLGTDKWCVSWKLYRSDGSPLPHDECPMAIALKEGRTIRGVEAIAERPDGTRVWFTPYPSPLRDAKGNIVGGINMLIDISERKQLEGAIGHLAAIVTSSDDAILSKDLSGIVQSWNQGAERLYGYHSEEIIGQSIYRIIPGNRQEEESFILDRIARGERIEHYETLRLHKSGRVLHVSLTVSPILNQQGQVIGASTIARDITETKSQLRQQQCLLELATCVNQSQTLSDIYDKALDTIIRSLQADRAAILLYDDGGVMRFTAVQGLSEYYQRAVEGHSPWKTDETDPRPIVLPNIEHAELEGHLKQVVLGEGIRAIAFIPLTYERRLIGKFMVYFDRPYAFSKQELELAQTLAHTLAFGIERKRAEEELRQSQAQLRSSAQVLEQLVANRTEELVQSETRLRGLATELNLLEHRERQRLATELHDHLQQLLVLGKLKLGQGKHLADTVPRCAELMEQVDEVLSDALKYTRTLVVELSPPALREEGFGAALKWLAEQMEQHHLRVVLDVQTEALTLAHDHAVLLFQSIRELLINSAKHAGTEQAEVRVIRRGEVLSIEVQDYGKGFDPSAAAESVETTTMSSKFGLFSIRERMTALGGVFELESAVGAGTRATLTVPISGSDSGGSNGSVG
jgi:PAS domain S-box-containing protein